MENKKSKKNLQRKPFVDEYEEGKKLYQYFESVRKQKVDSFNFPRTVAAFFKKNKNLVFLDSIYFKIKGGKKGYIIKKVVFYELFCRLVPKNMYYDLSQTGYHLGYVIVEGYAFKMIEALREMGYDMSYKDMEYFDLNDYELFVENRISKADLKKIKATEYCSSKAIDRKYYKYKLDVSNIEKSWIEENMESFRQTQICQKDKNELQFKKLLEELNIHYEYQKIIYVGKFYIADFYIPDNNVILEVDGGVHDSYDRLLKDRERDNLLATYGVLTIRFDNTKENWLEDAKNILLSVLKNKHTN